MILIIRKALCHHCFLVGRRQVELCLVPHSLVKFKAQ